MLGARIAALRRQAGLSQTRLAERLKISTSAVGMYEQGRREPSIETVIALAEIFGVSTDYLLTGRIPDPDWMYRLLEDRITAADQRLQQRKNRPFSVQELAVLFSAVLSDEA